MLEELLEELIENVKSYNPDADIEMIVRAYELGKEAHKGQYRNSGEPFFMHPLNVAIILSELNMDTATIVSGILHDVVEDTHYTKEDIEKEFGSEIAHIVDGVTKLKKIKYKTKQETQAENLRKMILAMSKDIRVIIVKLADRLHNMRTLEYMTEEKKKEKALETLEIYAPLAHRLGISKIKWELEDLSLRYLDPDEYYDLVEKVAINRRQREKDVEVIISTLEEELDELGIENEISGRPKSFYSIYKKMKSQNKEFDEIFDLTAIRVLVDSIKDCYGVLGAVHTLWKPLPGRFKDYIAMPKPNMYQSLHTTVIGGNGEIFEVQIRTHEMHKTAEYGIAAHWKYKEGGGSHKEDMEGEKFQWLRELLEWQNDVKDPKDFMETLKIDFFTDEVFVFTPNGDVINLPMGSTPIDFAYRIHTEVGNSCVGSKVDGRIVPLNYQLKNGNIVEIITSVTSEPSRDWLKIVKSNQAKNKIRQWFKTKDRDINLEEGKESLEEEILNNEYDIEDLMKKEWLQEVALSYGQNTIEDLMAAIGYGSLKANQVFLKLEKKYNKNEQSQGKHKKIEEKLKKKTLNSKEFEKTEKKRKTKHGVVVKDLDNIKISLSKCCNPVPGDSIIGYITMGRGITVHRTDCPNVDIDEDKERLITVEWEDKGTTSYEAEIQIKALDRNGLLAEIALKINEYDVGIVSINTRVSREGHYYINLVLKIDDTEELETVIREIGTIKSVLDVYRVIS